MNGAAGHGQGAIDATTMIWRKECPEKRYSYTFFQNEDIADYFTVKNPHYDENISAETVAKVRMESNILIEIPECMKQYLVLFTPNCKVTCVSSLQFQFDECFKEQGAADVDFPEDLEGFENDECDEGIDQDQQIFDSLSMSHHLCLFLQAILQNRFISLRLLKSELHSKA